MAEAEKFLNYRGDVSEMIELNENGAADIVGPDHNGELWEAVTVRPDGTGTRVGFAPLAVTNQERRINEEKEYTDD